MKLGLSFEGTSESTKNCGRRIAVETMPSRSISCKMNDVRDEILGFEMHCTYPSPPSESIDPGKADVCGGLKVRVDHRTDLRSGVH